MGSQYAQKQMETSDTQRNVNIKPKVTIFASFADIRKLKAKSSLNLIKYHATKKYWGTDV
jgi:hypothetical protein